MPPELSDFQRNPAWTIKGWINGDSDPSDCKGADEFMDKKIYSITKRQHTVTILDYLHGCKMARSRAEKMVSPQARKWCRYRSTDARLEQLCNEWIRYGAGYLRHLDAAYASRKSRFQEMTGGYYDLQMASDWAKYEEQTPGRQ